MIDYVKLTHLVAAIVWMGGMAFMLMALRPAATALLQLPERMLLMGAVWRRFFPMVMVSIVVLFATGTNLYTTTFRAMKIANGQGSVPVGWNVMLVLGLLMMLIFGHIYFSGYAKFKRAQAVQGWQLASQSVAQIHTLMMVNFLLGWLALFAVRLLR